MQIGIKNLELLKSLSHEDQHEFLEQLSKSIDNHESEGAGGHPDKIMKVVEKHYLELLNFNKLVMELVKHLNPITKAIDFNTIMPPTPEELKIIDLIIDKVLMIPRYTVRAYTVQTFLLGKLRANARTYGTDLKFTWNTQLKLPDTWDKIAREYHLSVSDVYSLRWGEVYLANSITNIQDEAKRTVRRIILDAKKNNISGRELEKQLRMELTEEGAPITRDWKRVAITEGNKMHNEGIIAEIPDGEWLIGISYRSACKWCLDNINGKIFYKLSAPPPPYENLDPQSKEYKAIATLWEKAIWGGKNNNINRGYSKRKRTLTGMMERNPHELAMPSVLCHPQGRCSWVRFYPKEQFMNDKGEVHLYGTKNKTEYLQWKKDFDSGNEPLFEALKYLKLS